MEKIIKNGITYFHDRGAIYSVDPPTAHFNLSEWSMEVPPFKPEHLLILGCAGNTVAKLVKIIHGDVPMVGVDVQESEPVEGLKFYLSDAEQFLKTCTDQFDCVIVDIFEGATIPRIARTQEFAELLAKVCTRLLIFHTSGEDILPVYEKYFFLLHDKAYKGTNIYYMSRGGRDDSLRIPRDI